MPIEVGKRPIVTGLLPLRAKQIQGSRFPGDGPGKCCQVQLPELFRRLISIQDGTVVWSKLLAGGTPEVENEVKRG